MHWPREKKEAAVIPPSNYYAATTSSSSANFRTRFASMSLHTSDCLRFLNFPIATVDLCRQVSNYEWKRGIKKEREYAGAIEFEFKGDPWVGNGDDAIEARRLVLGLLRALHSQGWVLMLSTDISKKNYDKDTLLFRYQSPTPAECEWGTIVFSNSDRLRFIDIPKSVSDSFISRLEVGMAREHSEIQRGVWEIRLKGSPWYCDGKETMQVRSMLLMLLEVLEDHGWTVYACVDQKNGGENSSDTDTWHMCKPKGWVTDTPVYHN